MAKQHSVKLLMREFVTRDVQRFIVSRPDNFIFKAGQGVELTINHPDWQAEGRPFTPTSLVDDGVIEFMIKAYPSHGGVTQQLHQLTPGAELLMSEPFGTISYQGPGVFIAGGAGITPFIAILRQHWRSGSMEQNSLIFSNKTPADVLCERELRHYMQDRCILTCTAEHAQGYEHGRVDKRFLAEKISDFDQNFYVCGPPPFMQAVNDALETLGATSESLIFEK